MEEKKELSRTKVEKAILLRFCHDTDSSGRLKKPFTFERNGKIMIAASNGFTLIYFENEDKRHAAYEAQVNVNDVIDKAEAAILARAARLSFEDLRTALRATVSCEEIHETCSFCEGTGEIECEECGNLRDCSHCDGEGETNKVKGFDIEFNTDYVYQFEDDTPFYAAEQLFMIYEAMYALSAAECLIESFGSVKTPPPSAMTAQPLLCRIQQENSADIMILVMPLSERKEPQVIKIKTY